MPKFTESTPQAAGDALRALNTARSSGKQRAETLIDTIVNNLRNLEKDGHLKQDDWGFEKLGSNDSRAAAQALFIIFTVRIEMDVIHRSGSEFQIDLNDRGSIYDDTSVESVAKLIARMFGVVEVALKSEKQELSKSEHTTIVNVSREE